MKVIAVATQKGGVGKTTAALEIAAGISLEYSKKVLLIDFDPQQNLTTYVDANNYEVTIYDVLHETNKIKESILSLELFDFIPASQELSKSDIEFTSPEDIFLLDDALHLIEDDYDYCIVDTGPLRNKLLQMTYVASNYIVAPCDHSEGGSNGLINIHHDIERMKNARTPLSYADIICCIINRFDKKTKISKTFYKILENDMKQINPKGFVVTIRGSVKADEAKLARKSIQQYSPYNNVSKDYKVLIKNIIDYSEEDR